MAHFSSRNDPDGAEAFAGIASLLKWARPGITELTLNLA
jgi:hypothetical protein